jgi:uncharacterized protein YggE
MKDNKLLLVVIALLLVVSIVATGVLILRQDNKSEKVSIPQKESIVNTISVSSNGKVTVLPDVGYISLGVETHNADVKKAENENSNIMDAIQKAVTKLGVEETDIKTTRFNIYPRYGEKTDKPERYMVSNTIEITVKKIEDISKIIDASVDAGANRTNNIRFDVLDREASYNEALQNAIENAKVRAQKIADAAGLKIVGVVTVNENSSAPTIFYNQMRYEKSLASDNMAPPISTGDMEITANVAVTYEVEAK